MRAVLIDDSKQDLNYAKRLTDAGLLCDPLEPPATLDLLLAQLREDLEEHTYDVVLLDYRLDDEPRDQTTRAVYRGGTVAAALKEYYPDIPLVLVTTEAKLERWLSHNPRVRRLFDFKILKESLNKPRERAVVAKQVKNLALGYRSISDAVLEESVAQAPWATISGVMHALPTEKEILSASHAGPAPVGTNEIAEWLLHDVLEYPGWLLNFRETAVRLGTTAASFEKTEVQEWLEPARYSGAFSELDRRWWRGRVAELLFDAMGADSFGASELRTEAIAQLAELKDLVADKCVWCGEGVITRACSRCHEAVDHSHYLVGNIDERPGWAEPFVVCFRCIQEGRAEDVQFVPGTSELVRALESGSLQRPAIDD